YQYVSYVQNHILRSFLMSRGFEAVSRGFFTRGANLSWFGANFLRVARNRTDLERIFHAWREIELVWSEFFTCRAKSNWHGADFSCVARNRTDLERILPHRSNLEFYRASFA